MAFGFQNEYNLTVKFCDIILLFTSKKEEWTMQERLKSSPISVIVV
jgi:hypothetical protein